MKLDLFINTLEDIAKSIDHPEKVNVEMADCVPVVNPIFKDGTVYITDVENDDDDGDNGGRDYGDGEWWLYQNFSFIPSVSITSRKD